MTKQQYRIWFVIMLIFAAIITTYTLSYIVTCPWHEVPQLGGDGGKNIYTYLYHILYDKGIWFTGMNYPYGEHIVFTDAQPLLSVPLSNFKSITIAQALTTMWWLIALSYILSIVYCYKILLRFHVAPYFAILFAGLITFSSPQLLRVPLHYALSYACIIPMIFYWTIQYHDDKKWKYPVYIFSTGVLMSMLHPYFSAMILIWAVCYTAAYIIIDRSKLKLRIIHCLPLLISALGVLAWFGSIMHFTDPVKDRPATPFGILENCTKIKEIFSSVYSPFWKFLKDDLHVKHIAEGGEGFVYAGITVFAVLFISLIAWLVRKKNKKNIQEATSTQAGMAIWLLMALFALLFSMGVPFVWKMEGLLDYLSFFKQFRTLGRFDWIYYYIITICSVAILNSWYIHYKKNKNPVFAYSILSISLLIWAIEASGYISYIRAQVNEGYSTYDRLFLNNQQNWDGFLKEHHHSKTDFQAVLVLPFFEVGSEKIWLGGESYTSAWGMAMGIQAGLQLHLPLIDAMMSRTSWSVAEKEVKIAGGPYTEKPLLNDMKNNKPFLFLNIDTEPLNDPDQQYLLEASEYLGHFQHNEVYVCYPDRIRKNDQKYIDWACQLLKNMNDGDDVYLDSSRIILYPFEEAPSWYINHFDNLKCSDTFFGNGAYMYTNDIMSTIATIPINKPCNNRIYEFSCWFLLSGKDYKSPNMILDFLNDAGKVMDTITIFTKESTDNHGLWFRCSKYFNLPVDCSTIRCRLQNEGHSYIAMDELLLRPADATIICKDKYDKVMVNNHLINNDRLKNAYNRY